MAAQLAIAGRAKNCLLKGYGYNLATMRKMFNPIEHMDKTVDFTCFQCRGVSKRNPQGASFSKINNFKTFIVKYQHAPGTARLQDVFCCRSQCQPQTEKGKVATRKCSQCGSCTADFYSPATKVCKTCVLDNNRETRQLAAQDLFEQTQHVAKGQKKFLTEDQTVEFNKKRKTMKEIHDDRRVKRRALQTRLAEEMKNSTHKNRAAERVVMSDWPEADRKRMESYWKEVHDARMRRLMYRQDPEYIARMARREKERQLRVTAMSQELKKHSFCISDYHDYMELQRWLSLSADELLDVLDNAGLTSGAKDIIQADTRAFRRLVSQREYKNRPPTLVSHDEIIARAEALAAINGDESPESLDELFDAVELAYECASNAKRIRRLRRLDDVRQKRLTAYEKARYLANPHRLDEYRKSESHFRAARTPKRMMARLLSNATIRGHCVEIDCDDLDRIASQPCTYCGQLRQNGESYHTDRFDNAIGYTKDNCVPCCTRCNMMKKALPVEAFLFRAFNVVYGFGQHSFECTSVDSGRWDYKASCTYVQYAKSAQKSGRKFKITVDEFNAMATSNCHYCCKPASSNGGSLGLDRLYSDLPYLLENVVPCCAPCNVMKRTMSVSEFKQQCKMIVTCFESQ